MLVIRRHALPLGPILFLIAGCGGGDGLPRERVSGMVTLDGQPVADGMIQFLPEGPADPSGAVLSGGATIKGGAYDIPRDTGLIPGTYKVSIYAASSKGEVSNDPGPGQRLPREMIPAKYNQQTTLTAAVEAGGDNHFDFPLTSK